MSNDFDFEDLGFFDSGVDEGDFGDSQGGFESTEETDDFGDFASLSGQQDDVLEDRQSVIKTSIISVIIGVMIIAGAFILMRTIRNKASGQAGIAVDVEDTQNVETIEEDAIEVGNNAENNAEHNEEWMEFGTSEDITFGSEYIDSLFTVTGIRNYVKIIDSKSNLMIKTVLIGNLSGFIGIYEVEVPYSVGSKLEVGNSFSVKVQLGNYKDKTVIGEIKY